MWLCYRDKDDCYFLFLPFDPQKMRITIKGKIQYSEFKIREYNSLKFKVSSLKKKQLEIFKKGVKKKRNFSKFINQNTSR